MTTRVYETSVTFAEPPETVFAFFSDAANLQRITPAFLDFRILTPLPIEMRPGALIEYRLKIHGVPVRWCTEISEWAPPSRFVDTQVRGPYRRWVHTHRFESVPEGTRMTDRVEYASPGWMFEPLVHHLFVKGNVERIFAHRREAYARFFTIRDTT